MKVYEVTAGIRPVLLRVDVGIVTVHENVCAGLSQCRREQIGGPEHVVLGVLVLLIFLVSLVPLGPPGPGVLRITIQTMYQNYVDLGVGMGIDSGGFVSRYFLVD